jgi:hypothetical protein
MPRIGKSGYRGIFSDFSARAFVSKIPRKAVNQSGESPVIAGVRQLI